MLASGTYKRIDDEGLHMSVAGELDAKRAIAQGAQVARSI
jgi:hypothetical protein